jgi:lipoprotein-anchoring transpeptidase ErfK/SrfK
MIRAALVAVLLSLVAAAPASAQDPAPTPTPTPTPAPARIAAGVSAAGVDLSNLTIDEATAKLTQTLTGPLAAPVTASVAGRTFRLKVARTKFGFDANRTARRAYYAGRDNPPPPPAGGGAPAAIDVPLAVTFRRSITRDFARSVARRIYVPARNATLKITLKRMIRRHSRTGRGLDVKALRGQIDAALADPRQPRALAPAPLVLKPKIDAGDLARVYGTVITVDKAHFRLRLFKRLKLSKSYGVAVGQPAYPTPSGLFSISNKQVNPTWTAPNSPWAGELAGQSIGGGDPTNPLKARWMGIANGVGIHGTGQEWSIGSRASHGCIRMRVADVIDLYPRVPVGTSVLIR